MSGYDTETGIFELTSTKASRWLWHRRGVWPDGFTSKENDYMPFVAELLEFLGYEVLKVRGGYLQARITPEELWEALSGKKSNPENTAYYYENQE